MFRLLLVAGVAASSIGPASAYTGPLVATCGERTERPRTPASFVENFTAHVLQELPCVWRENVAPALESRVESTETTSLKPVRLNAIRNDCDLQARYHRVDGTPTITIPSGFIKHWLYAEQARIFLALDEVDPALLENYYRRVFADAMFANLANCRINPKLGIRVPSILNGLVGKIEYYETLRKFQRDRVARRLEQDFFLSLMFVLAHEGGHHLLRHQPSDKLSTPKVKVQERDADNVAIRLFKKEHLSTSLALGGIITTSFSTAVYSDGSVNDAVCRVARIMRQDRNLIARLEQLGIHQRRARRIKRNHERLVRAFAKDCP